MTTSSVTSWELNRNQLVESAYRKIGLPGEGNTLSAIQYTDGTEALNGVIALAVTNGMPLWKRITSIVATNATSQVYTLSNAVKVMSVFLADSGGVKYELGNKSLYDFNRLPTNASGVPVSSTATGLEPVVSTEIPFINGTIASPPAFAIQSLIVWVKPST